MDFLFQLSEVNMTSSTDLESLQRADHDTIIRLEAKLDGLIADVKIMNDGMSKQIGDHEVRLRKIEDIVIQADPTGNIARLNKLEQEVRDFKTGANVYRVVAGAVGGMMVFVFSQLPTWLRLLGWVK